MNIDLDGGGTLLPPRTADCSIRWNADRFPEHCGIVPGRTPDTKRQNEQLNRKHQAETDRLLAYVERDTSAVR